MATRASAAPIQNTLFYGQGAIDGLQFCKGILYNDPERGWVEGSMGCYAPGYDNPDTGDFVTPMLCYIDNNDLYILQALELLNDTNSLVTISGSALPGVELYISYIGDTNVTDWFIVNLKRNKLLNSDGQILKTTASRDGTYSFDGLKNLSAGTLYVWYKTSTYYFSTAGLTVQMDIGVGDIDIKGYFIYKTKLTEKHYCSKCKVTYDCPQCQGTGTINNNVCPTCDGNKTILRGRGYTINEDGTKATECKQCEGTGTPKLEEYHYELQGESPAENDAIETNIHDVQLSKIPSNKLCPTCGSRGIINTTGTRTCPGCNGAGHGVISDSETATCQICGGTGSIFIPQTCPTCDGIGLIDMDNLSLDDLELFAKTSNTKQGGTLQISINSEPIENNNTTRRYTMVWDKLEDGNEDTRLVIWTCSDNEDDTINITAAIKQVTEVDPNGCLGKGTLITMADGSVKPIEDIKINDYVMDKNGNPSKVYYLGKNNLGSPNTYYYFEDGTVIHEIVKHRFYNCEQGFYQLLKNWKIGEHAINQNGEKIALINKEISNEKCIRYSIYCSSGNYYANGLLSGQGFCNQNFLSEMTAAQAVDMLISIDDDQVLFDLFGDKGALV